MRVFKTLAELASCTGQELGVSPWHTITQQQIDAFAKATLDQQWIHVNEERATTGPFKSTIAHGFLTLSLMPWCMDHALCIEEETTSINYGLNKVRFTSIVPVNAQVRARFQLFAAKALPSPQGLAFELTWDVVFEMNGQDKPVCIAQCVVRRYTSA